jgi:tRNA-dihydrouridine synthase B
MNVPSLRIGPHCIAPALGLAPMAGVTDKPFRLLCRRMGAGLATTEMTSANPQLRGSRKSAERLDHAGEPGPISVQIAGTEPAQMAEFARYNVEHGAEIIDINMGCPAKKVCKAWAGSALMRDEALVAAILTAVVEAVDVPVTLKIRTGWAADRKNAPVIARIAEDAGISALAIHGRTRDQKYQGTAEYDTIARIKQDLGIPVWANGDVDAPEKAREVLEHTRADGLLIGRAAQGRPWIFDEIRHFLATGERLPEKTPAEVGAILVEHLEALHDFYGAERGVRIARKHLGWYVKAHPGREAFLQSINRVDDAAEQVRRTREYFEGLREVMMESAA